jgi:spermidine synthase
LLLMDIKTQTTLFIALLTLGTFVYGVNITFEKNIFAVTNNYGNFEVITKYSDKNTSEKFLVINNLYHSCLTQNNQGCAYIEVIKKILFKDMKIIGKNILVLGAGGFTLSAENTYGNQFVYVDIDKKLPDIVRKNFQPHINGRFIADDARHFISTTPEHYDVIVSDAYNGLSVPLHLVTQEYFAAIRSTLTDDGIAVFNIVAKPTLQDPYSKHVDNTIRSVFKNCMVIPVTYYSETITNVVYICMKSNNEKNNDVYTDNLNRADSEYYALHL